ncbi:MAG TPA: hypothetical protein VNJ46_04375, partial [Gaiellaceae bacterium]|nr:hypothetical protein [Gaiellaceae bacterium]
YCLECGLRLGGAAPAAGGAGWVRRSLAALVVAAAGGAAAVAASGGGSGGERLLTATGGFAAPPAATTLASPGASRGVAAWPLGEEGWTVVLASVPQTRGRTPALRVARAARRAGLAPVGILDSSRFASLHPGYWVVFAGVYGSEAEATSALDAARETARTATVRRIVP